jgi:HK97 family phage portal protein
MDSLTTVMARGLTKSTPMPVRGSLFGWVREPSAGAWQRGQTVDPLGTIVSFSPVYACVTRIANDISKLGINLLQEQDDGTRTMVPNASPYWRAIKHPNTFQNRIQYVAMWMLSKNLYGNAYGLKVRDSRGIVTAVYILDPRRVTPMVTPVGDVYYSLGGDDLARVPAGKIVPASEIIHDRINPLWHPLVGVAPIYACALSATQGNRIQNNSAQFFENMSRPSGLLVAPGTIDEPTALAIKRAWEENYGANNLGRTAVLGDGMTYQAMNVPAEQSQLVEQFDLSVADVARAFGMPLYKIGAGPMPTNNNVQALNQQYYSDCLQVHIESFELCHTEGLGVPDGYGVEFDLDGLLRMDSATQIDVLMKGVGSALYTPNEGRKKLNLPPVTGGNSALAQQQNFSLEALAKRDAGPDPFGTAKAPAPPAAAAKEVEIRVVSPQIEVKHEEFSSSFAERMKQLCEAELG